MGHRQATKRRRMDEASVTAYGCPSAVLAVAFDLSAWGRSAELGTKRNAASIDVQSDLLWNTIFCSLFMFGMKPVFSVVCICVLDPTFVTITYGRQIFNIDCYKSENRHVVLSALNS